MTDMEGRESRSAAKENLKGKSRRRSCHGAKSLGQVLFSLRTFLGSRRVGFVRPSLSTTKA